MAELYVMRFTSGKSYIGVTSKTARYRYSKHCADVRRGSELVVHKAWRRYGAPSITTLAIGEIEYLCEMEIKAISVYGTLMPEGYNMALGGQTSPALNPDVAKKISLSKKGKPIHPNTRLACIKKNTGFKHSIETRKKLSRIRTGHTTSDETKRKISEAQKGRQQSAEAVAKMAQSLRGKKQTPESIAKRAEKMRGHRWADASYAKGWETRRRNALKGSPS